jgi:hypothetical protein
MRRLGIIAVLSLMALALAAVPAFAASPHFVGTPTLTDNGTTLTASGSIAGLGNQDIDVVLTASGRATVTCTNPAGKVAPGQTKSVTVTGSEQDIAVKNGRANFTVTTAEPVAPQNACPNAKWTPTVTNVRFTSATITVFQPAGSGNVVLQRTFAL